MIVQTSDGYALESGFRIGRVEVIFQGFSLYKMGVVEADPKYHPHLDWCFKLPFIFIRKLNDQYKPWLAGEKVEETTKPKFVVVGKPEWVTREQVEVSRKKMAKEIQDGEWGEK